MSAIILDGKELSRISEESIKKKVQELSSQTKNKKKGNKQSTKELNRHE
jgi:hypothetical protein